MHPATKCKQKYVGVFDIINKIERKQIALPGIWEQQKQYYFSIGEIGAGYYYCWPANSNQ